MKGGIKINCDVGEGAGNESELMPYIQQCNIACGGHAGDVNSMSEMVKLALKYKVEIGAHPSYPDRINFGRKSIQINTGDLIASIRNQIDTLLEVAKSLGTSISHIKAHGALYNDIAKDKELAKTYLLAVEPYKDNRVLVVPFDSIIAKKASEQGFLTRSEAFADRNYNDDLSLVSRSAVNAVLTDIPTIVKHVTNMKVLGLVVSINRRKIKMIATTFCVHSDTSNVIDIVKELNRISMQ